MKVLEGYLNGKGMKIGIVAARFNEFITSKLLSGAVDTLKRRSGASRRRRRRHFSGMGSRGF